MSFLCEFNEFLCQYSHVLVIILVLTVLTFIISIYTCFVKCKRMQTDIDQANRSMNEVSTGIETSQKQVSECLKIIEIKISEIENKLNVF